MPGPRFEVDETEVPTKAKTKEKKPRGVAVRDASFFLFKILDSENLSPIGSYGTESEVREAYENTLDGGILEEDIRGFKGRVLKFEVKETKRRITVR